MPYVDKFDFDEGDAYEGSRICKQCGERKHITEFHWGAAKRYCRRTCKSCQHTHQRILKKTKDPERLRLQVRELSLRKKYGMTQDDYLRMRDEQEGLCLICRELLPEPAHVDHCHDSGQVRELLCLKCNVGIGNFNERPEVLIWAAAYLLRRKRRTTSAVL